MLSAVLAMLMANSALNPAYADFVGATQFWINDLLMALFFLYAGLEIKRELTTGTLATPARAMLPVLAAIGGMVVPALIYLWINRDLPQFQHGWAIPTATDIAFAVGVLALVASRLPPALKVLLLAIAVIDDLGAIIVIAAFYTDHIVLRDVMMAVVCMAVLWSFNRRGLKNYIPYFLVGVVLWIAMLRAGIHPTLSGVLLAFAIPTSRLESLQSAIHPYVVFAVLPLFGFANAGVSLAGITAGDLFHPVTLGIALGLFVGKQIGIFGSIWILAKARICAIPEGITWPQIYGMSLLCGIGFTMALFVGGLAFSDPALDAYIRMGVMGGSLLSAVLGIAVLYKVSHPK